MDDDRVVPLTGGTQDPWPEWRHEYPLTAPDGHPYVLAAVRMTVPANRHWQQHRLVENVDLPVRLGPLFSTVPVSHSLLQEPHGGQHCRFSTTTGLRLWQDSDPDRWPNTLYRRFEQQDGPRRGLGEVTVTLRLRSRDGVTLQVVRTISECNVRADARLVLAQLPRRLTDVRA
ncbi:hypothetical protein [Streptomyces xantholiticus]|uniref:hypothetical protein n=1 Tax=Streptomyces xantholiticus TaxID=68285 RepID=UPI0019A51EC5|nr:hypothetical protein [Streptomyces xantholiticus]GGW52230.1 hypothetical protein GCM10010381_42110 [Streptomyces xantholiticus]